MTLAPRQPATLADIAREAGLSVPTVSRALRNHPDVSETTRTRVQTLAANLGYRTSAAARALRTGRHDTIGLVLPEEAFGWWEPLAKAASRAAAAHGFHLLLTPIGGDQSGGLADDRGLADFFEFSSSLPVDGFIVVTPDGDEWKTKTDRPVVIIDDMRRHPGHHVLLADNVGGSRIATQHLIDTGRTRIIAVAPDWPGGLVRDRLEGYERALSDAGLTPRVVATSGRYPPVDEFSPAVDELLRSGEHFDGVFALADYLTFAVFRSLRRGNKRIPEDVSVVGFDDGLAAMATDPTLTTVAQPLDQIGARAVDTLIRLVNGDPVKPRIHRLPTHLVIRGSA